MAQRRMVSVKIIDSAKFIKMPVSTQALYFHLLARADDDGIVEAFNIMRMTGSSEDDLKVLTAKEFVKVLNDDLVTYITDWHEHNLIRADRKIDSIYQSLLLQVVGDVDIQKKKQRADRMPQLQLGTSHGQPTDGIGKVSLGKVRKEKSKEFMPPTIEQVEEYFKSESMTFDYEWFYKYYKNTNWINSNGKPVANWKNTMHTWQNREPKKTEHVVLDMNDNDTVNAMLRGRL